MYIFRFFTYWMIKCHERDQMNEIIKTFYRKISNISCLVTYYMVDKEILLAIINQVLICRITIGLPSVLYQTSRVISANAMFFILFFSDVVFVRYDFLHNLQDYFLLSIHFYYTEENEIFWFKLILLDDNIQHKKDYFNPFSYFFYCINVSRIKNSIRVQNIIF